MRSSTSKQPEYITQAHLRGKIGIGVKRAFSFFYPNYSTEDEVFTKYIIGALDQNSVVLDAGCGSGAFFRYPWKEQVRLLVGCDVGDSIGKNHNLQTGVRADLSSLPFARGSFDLIFSRYVLEHLQRPKWVFQEFARLLKPGGKLVMLTPSKFHYVALIGKFTPHWFHETIANIRGNKAHDTFPTVYRANSRKDLGRWGEEAGLTLQEFVSKETCPNYLLWSLPSFLLGVVYERLVNYFDKLAPFRVSIVAVFEKEK